MPGMVVQGPPQLWVKWGCRRCKFEGGVAHTTVPINGLVHEAMLQLMTSLRKKLIVKHYDLHKCLATHEDLKIERVSEVKGKEILGKI